MTGTLRVLLIALLAFAACINSLQVQCLSTGTVLRLQNRRLALQKTGHSGGCYSRARSALFCEAEEASSIPTGVDPSDVKSKEIDRMLKKIDELQAQINEAQAARKAEEEVLAKLDAEFGGEIQRINKEFARMKERNFEEALEISNQAKSSALKEVLPITDNYARAKKVFEPVTDANEQKIVKTYDAIFNDFTKVIEGFGVTRVVSVGQPYDYNFMEAIMTAPSTEYAADIVCTEYQIGYKMGAKCIRPAMVVVSTGPGPK